MVNEIFKEDRFVVFDGGMGTMLQAAGLKPGQSPERFAFDNPRALYEIECAYIEAGAEVLCTNTFGANAKKLAGSGISVAQAVEVAVDCAKRAAAGKALVALDVGPLGEMMEPGGTLSFEEAYSLFKEVVDAGVQAGADLVIIETMTDLLEVKAAVLAALENSELPVLVSMTFEADGRTFAGVPVENFAASIGRLGVAGLGINCSLGPVEIEPLVQRLCAATNLPVFVQPNAGLPDPATGEYHLSPEDFCGAIGPYLDMGVSAIGGCCGTNPDYIRLLARRLAGLCPVQRRAGKTAGRVCGATRAALLDRPLVVGERINPTGKKRLREALQAGDIAYIQTLAVEQEQAGADILDVNVGAPGVDEVEMLPRAVRAVQAVSGLPLQLDSANPAALAAALRVCIGRPVVNSTSGEKDKLETVLPLCKKYGAAVVGLALDEDGIPETAEGRLAVARKIKDAAVQHGLTERDVFIDCLTLSVGAQPEAGRETLRTVALVRQKLGMKTMLGVSNVSFGLPNRPLVNRTFLAMALASGLDIAIINPADAEMMGMMVTHRLLDGIPGGADDFVVRYGAQQDEQATVSQTAQSVMTLDVAIEKGLATEAREAAKALLANFKGDKLDIVEQYMIPALDRVGQGFEQKRIFLPQLLSAATAAQAAFEVLRGAMGTEEQQGPPVVVATVQGDVHDIGKNIAKVLLQNYGFAVTDLGRDVPPQRVVEAVQRTGAKLVGLSALMTTTLPSMEATIEALKQAGADCKVLVGGAVLTENYAKSIGADFYARDAKASADYAREVYAK